MLSKRRQDHHRHHARTEVWKKCSCTSKPDLRIDLGPSMYWIHVCPHKSIHRCFHPPCDGIWLWDLWEITKLNEVVKQMPSWRDLRFNSSLQEEWKKPEFLLCSGRTEPGRGLSQCIDLGLSASRTSEINVPCLSHRVHGILW